MLRKEEKRQHPNRLRNRFDLFTAWKNVTLAHGLQNNVRVSVAHLCQSIFIYINTIKFGRLNGHVAPICFTTVQRTGKKHTNEAKVQSYCQNIGVWFRFPINHIYVWHGQWLRLCIPITVIRTYSIWTLDIRWNFINLLLKTELISLFATAFGEIEISYFDAIFEIKYKDIFQRANHPHMYIAYQQLKCPHVTIQNRIASQWFIQIASKRK